MKVVPLFLALLLWVIVSLISVEAVCADEPVLQPAAIQSAEKAAIINKWSSVKFDHGISPAFVWTWVLIVAIAVSGTLLLFLLWTKSLKKQVQNRTAELSAANLLLEFEIAEHKLIGEKLLISESKYRTLLENLPQKIFLKDRHSTYISCNSNYARDLGIMPEKIAGKTDYDFFPRELADKYQGDDNRVLESGQTEMLEEQYERDGKRTWIAIIKTPVLDDKGSVTGLLGALLNITERRRADEKLQQYQQRLKSLAVQLTLSEEQERRRIAEDLHDHIGQSLALARMQLAAACKGIPKSDVQNAQFDAVSQSLLKAIQDTRHLIFELSSPSLNELGLAAAIREWMDEKIVNNHGLEAEFFDHTQGLSLNKDLRAILFRNVRELLTNAIKHARAETISVWLESRAENLEITIQDDDVGFDPCNCRQNGEDCGGFGLFSVHERMTDLGGKLMVSSQPGEGCKAVLVLPMQSPETEA
jgi:PAS domain S-box-containing protein